MEVLLNSETSKKSDIYTEEHGKSSLSLMESAGKACFKLIKKELFNFQKVVVICGSGGNGGDGFVIARYLLEENYDVGVFCFGNHFKNETLINKDLYKGKFITSLESIDPKNTMVIDALLGVGINKELREDYVNLINSINKLNAKVISIDINSGINADNGLSLGAFIKSDLTIAIERYKLGHFFNEGIDAYKRIKKVKIGLKIESDENLPKILEEKDFKELFPKRDRNINKGTNGRVALIGGSKLTPGAINLSLNALSALRMGVGYACLAIPSSLYPLYALKNNENIYNLLSDNEGNVVFKEEEIKKMLHYDAIAIGMGIGTSIEVYKIIEYLLQNYKGNLLIDADGLNSLATYGVEILKNKSCNVFLTPHLKEFSRLINEPIDVIKKDYIKFAKEFALKYGVYLNLKNDVSVITDGKTTYINICGNSGLAKGGSGDVLSGITIGLLTKKTDLSKLLACGAYILGEGADRAVFDINEYSLIAGDLSKYIVKIVNNLAK